MQQARQLRQQGRITRRFGAQGLDETAPADLLAHPAFQPGLGGLPQIEFGIELQAQTFDVEQSLLQQHQLRLDLDAETARGLEQAQQHLAERNFAQRLVENRFAHRADRGFEFVHAGIGRRPAGFDVQLGHTLVVAVEESDEVLREVILVGDGERAHDAEIQRHIAPVARHQNVAGVHVGMEKTVAEHLRIKDLHAVAGQFGQVDTRRAQTPRCG